MAAVAQGSGGAAAPAWKPSANPWLIALAVTTAAFMEVLDTTIVNVSLPHIAGSLSVSFDDTTWALTSYLVANGIVLTISGWLSDVFGRKRYFLTCIALFTVSSFLCGIAQNLPELIAFRLMQGFFGGGLQPSQQSIMLDTFEPAQRGRAFGLTAIATIVAPVLGPTLGGYITDHVSWNWIFFINLPVGVIAFFAVSALVEDPPWAGRQKRALDAVGLGFIVLFLGCLQIMLDRGEDENWFSSGFIQTFALLSLIGLIGAVTWLVTAKRPIVHLGVLADRNFAIGSLMIFSTGLVLYSSAVIIPQFAEQVMGYTATLSGLILSPGALLVIAFIPVTLQLMARIQTRLVIALGFMIMALGMLYSSNLVPDITFHELIMMRSSQAAGLAFLFVPISTVAYSTLPRELNNDASALFTMFRNVGGSIGISLSTALIATRIQVHESYLAQWTGPLNEGFNALIARLERTLHTLGMVGSAAHNAALGQALGAFRRQASVLAFSDVYVVCAAIAFLLVPTAFLFSPIKKAQAGGAA